MALPYEDRALLQDTLVSLSVESSVIDEIMAMLNDQSTQLEEMPLPTIQEAWFGDSRTGGYRLATNAIAAGVVVDTEMLNLVIGLREYVDVISAFADDVVDTDHNIAVTSVNSLARIENAANCADGAPATACTPRKKP